MSHTNRLSTLFLLVALLLSACQPIRPDTMPQAASPSAAAATRQLDEATIAAIEAMVQKTMSDVGIPGLALGIVVDGEIAYTKGFGVERLGSDKPVTPHTIFGTGSIGKTGVATAIMQLVEAGKLDLNKPVTDYLPYFKLADERYKAITVYHLVTHRSGIPEVTDWYPPEEFDDGVLERYVRSFTDVKLDFAPGEKFSYSGRGYIVLADIIAKASGQTFEEYLQENILDPLGMKDTILIIREAEQARIAAPHVRKEGKIAANERIEYRRQTSPTATFCFSITDMARYVAAHLNRGEFEGVRILTAASYDEMWKPVSHVGEGLQADMGMSFVNGTIEDHHVINFFGLEDGFEAGMILAPDDKIAVVMSSNYFDWTEFNMGAWETTVEIMRLLLTQ
jgi:CubicO group peptidase (beta-lactamase class C family)